MKYQRFLRWELSVGHHGKMGMRLLQNNLVNSLQTIFSCALLDILWGRCYPLFCRSGNSGSKVKWHAQCCRALWMLLCFATQIPIQGWGTHSSSSGVPGSGVTGRRLSAGLLSGIVLSWRNTLHPRCRDPHSETMHIWWLVPATDKDLSTLPWVGVSW